MRSRKHCAPESVIAREPFAKSYNWPSVLGIRAGRRLRPTDLEASTPDHELRLLSPIEIVRNGAPSLRSFGHGLTVHAYKARLDENWPPVQLPRHDGQHKVQANFMDPFPAGELPARHRRGNSRLQRSSSFCGLCSPSPVWEARRHRMRGPPNLHSLPINRTGRLRAILTGRRSTSLAKTATG